MSKKKETLLVDIMADTLGLTFDGVDFDDRFAREARQNRMFGIMNSKENNWARLMYEAFLQRKSHNSSMSAHDFLDTIKASYTRKGIDVDKQLAGVIDFETMGNVFDTFEGFEDSNVLASFLASTKTKQIASEADLAYFYMDQVSQMISADEGLRENYASMDAGGRQTMIRACLKSLKAKGSLKNPTAKQIKSAQNRWRSYYRKSSDESIMIEMRESGVDITEKDSFLSKFASSISEVIRKDDSRYLSDRRGLREAGEPMVDYDKNPDSAFSRAKVDVDTSTPEGKKEEENLIEFGKIYPRATPQFKIAKMLQPFNIKAGLKFLDQIIEAFQSVQVANPWAKSKASSMDSSM